MVTQRRWFNRFLALLLISLMFVLEKGDATSESESSENSEPEYTYREQDRTTTMGRFEWEYRHWGYRTSRPSSNFDRIEEEFGVLIAETEKFLGKLKAIDRDQLDRDQQYAYDTLHHMLSTKLNNYKWCTYGPLNPINFIHGGYYRPELWYEKVWIMFPPLSRVGWITDRTNFSAKREIPETMVWMDKAIELGTTYHLASVKDVPVKLAAKTSVPPEQSFYYGPWNTQIDSLNISQSERDSLRSRGLAAFTNLWQALDGLREYMIERYIPNTRKTYSVYGLPSGKALYRACLNFYVTYDVTPEEVHRIGLKEVDRITRLMYQVMRSHNFNGTIRQYFNKLENDPRFQLTTSEQVIEGYTDIIKNRIYPKLSTLFEYVPADRITVKRSYNGPYSEYLRFHGFLVNTDRPSDTKTFTMLSWALQAAYPGDYLRDQYQMHRYDGVSFFYWFQYRNVPFEFPDFTNFYGGWRLYTLYLAEEMGLYLDDNEIMGRYSAEMLHACHLVLDTGLHHYGWSRKDAIDYLHARVSMSLHWVEWVVDRYITYPGEAVAYKMGERTIRKLRKMAETTLGAEKFDIHEFHSRLLKKGRVPAYVLKNIVLDYIDDTLTGTMSSASADE